MPLPPARAPRLFVAATLAGGEEVSLPREQAHYLLNVMRLKAGDAVVLFNGCDGEWAGVISSAGKRAASLTVADPLRPQSAPRDIRYCFAPLKRARTDFIAEKATELGASMIQPVMTHHTVAERVRTDRLRANAVEAAEQCGILWVPEVGEPVSLDAFLSERDPARLLVFCDEAAPVADPLAALRAASGPPLDVLIGPEGGFAREERETLYRLENVVSISLGPRVMRADTAGVAALALVQAVLGDWR